MCNRRKSGPVFAGPAWPVPPALLCRSSDLKRRRGILYTMYLVVWKFPIIRGELIILSPLTVGNTVSTMIYAAHFKWPMSLQTTYISTHSLQCKLISRYLILYGGMFSLPVIKIVKGAIANVPQQSASSSSNTARDRPHLHCIIIVILPRAHAQGVK